MKKLSFCAANVLESSLKTFMRSRCDVSSQHKLPGIEELLSTYTVDYLKKGYGVTDDHVKELVETKIANGEWYRYGPYISDRPNEVM